MDTMKQRAVKFCDDKYKAVQPEWWMKALVEFATAECERQRKQIAKACETIYLTPGDLEAVKKTILSTPIDAPASPFGCGCWRPGNPATAPNGAWLDADGTAWSLGGKIKHCPFCGAKRVQT